MNKKQYKIKKTKELINKLKPYWKKAKKIEDKYSNSICKLEYKMQNDKNIGITDLEFFFNEWIVGIGNISRTMELIQAEELE